MEVYVTTRKVEKVTIDDKVAENLIKGLFQDENYSFDKSEDIRDDIIEAFYGDEGYELLKKNGVVELVYDHYCPYLDRGEAYSDMEFGIH